MVHMPVPFGCETHLVPIGQLSDGRKEPEMTTWSGPSHTIDPLRIDRKSTRLNSSHLGISYAVFCLKKKTTKNTRALPLRRSTGRRDPRRQRKQQRSG